jgi:uncharacterized membrane protein
MLAANASIVKRSAGATLAPVFSRRTQLLLALATSLHFALLLTLAALRYENVHQRTFDLALYARIAWGFAHADLWSPVLDAHALGSHVAPVLLPLGLLGRLFGTVPVLLFVQSACIALTLHPLARIGARRSGTRGVWLAVAAFIAYPNLFHVGTYEFHPGTLAILPMTWGFDALDRMSLRQLVWSLAAVLMCREDLGLFCLLLSFVYFALHHDRRALYVSGGCLLYTALALLLTHSLAPQNGSLAQHFGVWGGSPLGVFRTLLEDPSRVSAHFAERKLYLPRVLAPLSFFSLRAPHLLLPALPYLILNLLSAFPTADEQYSHYLTPALPALLVSGLVGVTSVRTRFVQVLWFVTLGISHVALGGSPLSRDFDGAAFRADDATDAAEQVLAQIPPGASVQAPDALLPHLAERHELRRAPPPETHSEYVVLDIAHRLKYARQEVLLRTSEEPLIRDFLARNDHVLLVYAPPYALFARPRDARAGVAANCFAPHGEPARDAAVLTSCLALEHATLARGTLTLTLSARGACPGDLALRLGADAMPARVELLCDGKLSPALLRAGDRVRSQHLVSEREQAAIRARGLYVGTLRASGAPALAGEPAAIPIHLQLEGK